MKAENYNNVICNRVTYISDLSLEHKKKTFIIKYIEILCGNWPAKQYESKTNRKKKKIKIIIYYASVTSYFQWNTFTDSHIMHHIHQCKIYT